MNILYINHYAGSPLHGMEFRPYYLARAWVRAGHSVRILACGFSHVRTMQPVTSGNRAGVPNSEWMDGIEYVWYPAPAYKGNGIGRVRNIWSFLRQIWMDAKRISAGFKPDVVIASSTYPMDIWVAKRIAHFSGAKLIFEVHDLWPLSPIELGGMSPHHPFIRLCQWAEKTAYQEADAVVSMLPCVHEYMVTHGLDLRRLHIIPNGIDPDEWIVSEGVLLGDLATHIDYLRSRGDLVVGYAGAHGLPNALDALLDAAALLKGNPIGFVLVGDGHEKIRLQQRVQRESLVNLTMFEPIPKAWIPNLLHRLDIAFIGWQNQPIYRFGISPNKLLDYMMAACPVLHSVSAGNDPVTESKCGLSVPAESPKAIADGILMLAGLSGEEREEMGKKGKAYVQSNHAYSILADQFLTIMQ